jgi:hypothetical protein
LWDSVVKNENLGWQSGSSARVPVYKTQGPQFKPLPKKTHNSSEDFDIARLKEQIIIQNFIIKRLNFKKFKDL